MVQGLTPINLNNTVQTPVAEASKTPPVVMPGLPQDNHENKAPQGGQLLPSMPMPAQVNMPKIELPPVAPAALPASSSPQVPAEAVAPVQENAAANALTPPAQGTTSNNPNPVGVLNPPTNISTNPLNDRYGYVKNDPYGLKNPPQKDLDFIPSQGLNLFPEAGSYYNYNNAGNKNPQGPLAAFGLGGSNGQGQGSFLGNLLKTAVLIGAGVFIFKSVKSMRGAKNLSDNINIVKDTCSHKFIRETEPFKEFYKEVMDNPHQLTPKSLNNIKLKILDKSSSEIRDCLSQTRELATEYSRMAGVHPRYMVYMKEGMEHLQDPVIKALKVNDVSSLSDDVLKGIEEINLIAEKAKKGMDYQSDILFHPVVRNNVNRHNTQEVARSAGQRLRENILNFLE